MFVSCAHAGDHGRPSQWRISRVSPLAEHSRLERGVAHDPSVHDRAAFAQDADDGEAAKQAIDVGPCGGLVAGSDLAVQQVWVGLPLAPCKPKEGYAVIETLYDEGQHAVRTDVALHDHGRSLPLAVRPTT